LHVRALSTSHCRVGPSAANRDPGTGAWPAFADLFPFSSGPEPRPAGTPRSPAGARPPPHRWPWPIPSPHGNASRPPCGEASSPPGAHDGRDSHTPSSMRCLSIQILRTSGRLRLALAAHRSKEQGRGEGIVRGPYVCRCSISVSMYLIEPVILSVHPSNPVASILLYVLPLSERDHGRLLSCPHFVQEQPHAQRLGTFRRHQLPLPPDMILIP
jgi:hypothetical protein